MSKQLDMQERLMRGSETHSGLRWLLRVLGGLMLSPLALLLGLTVFLIYSFLDKRA